MAAEAESPDEIVLDVRGLEPPQPLERALDESAQLKAGQRLRMIHHREPCLLYPLLKQRGFCYRTADVADDRFELLIWRKDES